jgi:hypothetical protein
MWKQNQNWQVTIAPIVLGGIYVCQTRVTIERQMPSLYSWRMEGVDSYNKLFIRQ